MLSVESALDQILNAISPLDTVRTPLIQATGAVLAEEILADVPVPAFDNSAVDGYAVRSQDTRGAAPDCPVMLHEIGEITAGQTGAGEVEPGMAYRIMTGAPLPSGADAVVMVEDTERSAQNDGAVAILEEATSEQHVRRGGSDIAVGQRVLSAGTRIRPAEAAMLATMGRAFVKTVRRPQVAVFSTGDELEDIDVGVPGPGKIRDSNRYTLAALASDAGADVRIMERIPDDLTATRERLRRAADPEWGIDVIITAGGVSVGDRDFVKPALESLGTLSLWRVAMKPGKPVAFGAIGRTRFFGLPGNPISAMVTFELFVRPALRKLAGMEGAALFRRTVNAILTQSVRHAPGRREYMRAFTEYRDGGYLTAPAGGQGSGMLMSAICSNSLLILPEESELVPEGSRMAVILTD